MLIYISIFKSRPSHIGVYTFLDRILLVLSYLVFPPFFSFDSCLLAPSLLPLLTLLSLLRLDIFRIRWVRDVCLAFLAPHLFAFVFTI